jgi:GT2 family glycosyltransferase
MVINQFKVGVVVIGRNEGQRLRRCLESVSGRGYLLVYVDSGSTDRSMIVASEFGVKPISLDMSTQFTAARARNVGFEALLEHSENIKYAQFVDGDCEVDAVWITKGVDFLESHQEIAVVSGRCRERYPENSIYNLMCDLEWNTPIGEAKSSGGNALMRVKALVDVKGFRSDLIAGEEPELCVRMRAAGWKIWRLEEEMVLHDAAITKFSQWWKRNIRGGYAFAEGAYLHGHTTERHWVVESRRSLIWGLCIPIVILLLTLFSWQMALLTSLVYPLQLTKLWLRNKQQAKPYPWRLAGFSVIGKFAEMIGHVRFRYQKLLSKPKELIEYK